MADAALLSEHDRAEIERFKVFMQRRYEGASQEAAYREAFETELAPKACPRCGRAAHFRYLNASEAAKRSPLCWGEAETDCPGMARGQEVTRG